MPIPGIVASQITGHLSTNSFESIATVTIGSPTATVTFASIPQTYKHLQIRGIAQNTQNTGSNNTQCFARFNNDSGSNYTMHQLKGNGSSVTASANTPDTGIYGLNTLYTGGISAFNGFVIDILDYTNTSKYKTLRALNGYDANGSGIIELQSGSWMNTAAITRIDMPEVNGSTYGQYSTFALYGIKG